MESGVAEKKWAAGGLGPSKKKELYVNNTYHMQIKALLGSWGGEVQCTSAGLARRLAGTGGGNLLPQAGQSLVLAAKAPAALATLWGRRSSELMAQLEWGGHCVMRTDWVCALSREDHWLHCLA